jgi:serine/threonine protein kinase
LAKQQQVFGNLGQAIKKYDSGWLSKDQEFMDLMCRMLDFNPMRRLSPAEIIQHPFVVKAPY